MKRLICTQNNPQYGKLSINIRFLGKIIFMKFNDTNPQANQMISQMKKKGAEITEASGWYRIDIFNENKFVKLGEEEFNVTEKTDEEIEQILLDFYYKNYSMAKFSVQRIDE